jgi:glutamyl-tRNA reductase
MNKKDEARKAEMEKVKAMTEEERKAYFEANKPTFKVDMFEELVAEGIINQTQADKIKAALPKGGEHEGVMKAKIDFTTAFDSLVSAGTITQAQEDKIVEFMKQKAEARKAEMEKVKAMTEEERKAYFEANKAKERPDLFKELVDAGILNQAQADAAKKALPEHSGPRGDKAVTPKASQE